MVTDFKTTSKGSELFDTLFAHFGKTVNLARIRFLSKMLKAIVILRTVNFAKLATAFGGMAESLSSMRRIQRFMAGSRLSPGSSSSSFLTGGLTRSPRTEPTGSSEASTSTPLCWPSPIGVSLSPCCSGSSRRKATQTRRREST